MSTQLLFYLASAIADDVLFSVFCVLFFCTMFITIVRNITKIRCKYRPFSIDRQCNAM